MNSIDLSDESDLEGQPGVNYLGHFLLIGLLLPLIKHTPKVRIVSLDSQAANWGGINWKDVHFPLKWDEKSLIRKAP